jgi:hypothetical protein
MAIHTDPRTGERREIDDLVRPTTYGSSWGLIGALIIAVALAAFFFLGRTPSTVETPSSAVTQPAPVPAPVDPAPTTPSATTPSPDAPAAPSNEPPAQPPTTP